MSRYQVLKAEEAVSQGYALEKFRDWELYDVLVDTERKVVVWPFLPATEEEVTDGN